MYEFDTVSASSYEASSLAAKLTERSGDGWDVVAIVPAGSEVTAFLKRTTSDSASGGMSGTTDTARSTGGSGTDTGLGAAGATAAGAGIASSVSEPEGWGSAPASSTSGSDTGWGSTSAETGAGSSGGWGGAAQAASTPSATSSAASTTASSSGAPYVPAGWYSDPSGRNELRYWDGSAWTEHVSRGGQQYTDPPVA